MAEYVAYVNALELNTADDDSTPQNSEDDRKSFAVCSSLVSFPDDSLSNDSKAAITNTTLLAFKAAEKTCDKDEDPISWYKKYVEVLGVVGWNIQNQSFTSYQTAEADISFRSAILETLPSSLPPTDVEAVEDTLDAISKPSADKAWKLFADSASKDNKSGSFQIAIGQEDRGSLVMYLSAFNFVSSVSEKRFLFVKYKKSHVKLYFNTQTAVLNMDVYDRVKDAIISKLGRLVEVDIIPIDI